MSPNYILRKCTGGYKFTKSQENINHLIYMDDIKIFIKNEKRTRDTDTDNENVQPGYRNGICHWKMNHTDNEKLENRNNGKNRTVESENLGRRKITSTWKKTEADTIKQRKRLLKSKLCNINFNKGINSWAVPLIRYSRPFLKWTGEKIRQINHRKRELRIMCKVFHSRGE